ncbi:sulfite exporter TauE/SafE family protein [Mycolicibacterium wolinskyi]|uniref:Probable membrane transporter protein n=1 Tax=Mycolicibacterium wolinskyi TaxID=59750 RepID=A0A1X2ER91_9MYCO|nr:MULTISPECIES: sulfite exporter TauE/SafE family protein [Mycolicibacterium]MCV7284002.1 sulfite exporter TauE/SafE family protein [Mycolicibacterium wolinskyi]MCV7296158.1 sulfite exporter TauE/SafE family protein [Mycolicibacterium goodii]ORX08713.1 permease [Mycolicibacterium wolinskyi]
MRSLIIFALVGLGAQIVDGALGMAFGVTASTLLVLSGVAAAQASAAVHLAEVGTTLASGLSHWRFKNIDWKIVLKLGVPGAIGAFLGATVLSSLSTEDAAPLMAGILLAIGVYVLLRFSLRTPPAFRSGSTPHTAKFLTPLGLFGGFIDASGGGGWGPITTSTLLSRGKTAPRTVIGSVSASEFLVAVSASLGFLVGLREDFLHNIPIVLGLAAGGVIAAPLAAWLVSKVSPALLGTAVGGVIVLTNAQKLLKYFGIHGAASTAIYTTIAVVWAGLVVYAWRTSRAPEYLPEALDAEAPAEEELADEPDTAVR